jgi:hypothetical protein
MRLWYFLAAFYSPFSLFSFPWEIAQFGRDTFVPVLMETGKFAF